MNILEKLFKFQITNPHPPMEDFDLIPPITKRYRNAKWTEVRKESKIGRNEICPKCSSGLKYKKCCGM